MEIIKNNKGVEKLYFESYMYTKKSMPVNRMRWDCSQRKAKNCKGVVTTSSQIAEDLEELGKLLRITTRPRVKDMLVREMQKLQQLQTPDQVTVASEGNKEGLSTIVETANVETNEIVIKSEPSRAAASVSRSTPQRYYKEITTYAWDQSDKFMKIYVTMNGVHKIDKSNLNVEYTANSFQLKVDSLNGANYICRVVGLWGKISVADSYHKIKTDTVLLMLKKADEKKTWAYVTEREDKSKKPDSKKLDTENKDPSEGLMDMLKKMYDEGDEDLKRSIAKAWTESRSKMPNDL